MHKVTGYFTGYEMEKQYITGGIIMRKRVKTKIISAGLIVVMTTAMLTGCRFGFASDPDDPNEEEKAVPIDTSVDTFEYDSSLKGTNITLLNSKAEIQVALEAMGAAYEEKSGVHVEVMPVTDGDSPYTKVVSLYNSGNPPTASILDTTDVIALAEEKAAELSGEPWIAEAEGYVTEINGKVYSFPLCIEGRGIIYNKKAEDIKDGKVNLKSYGRMEEFLDMFDILKKYNVAKGDPLGADYDEMAIDLADAKTAFWFNGNWAWPNLSEAGAESEDAYGFLPYFMNNDAEDFANRQIQASPSKQVMLDGQYASDQEQKAAKEFLNWMVFSEIGQQMMVKTCNIIPPFQNNPYEPLDPLSRDIYERVHADGAFNASAIVPNDHWAVLGASMQKYLADRSDRKELMKDIQKYWDEQE